MMFDGASIREWCNSLTGVDKEYVRLILRNYRSEHGDDVSIEEALVYARKTIILRDAIRAIASMQCKTPREVYKELSAKG